MVRKNQIKIKKPVIKIGRDSILMDQQWLEHTKQHLDEIHSQMPIKNVLDKKDHIIVEFLNEKTATMFRLKYGHLTK